MAYCPTGVSVSALEAKVTDPAVADASVVDVKTWGRNDGIKKFWRSAEMGVYAYLFTAIDGAFPKRLAYQAYVRVSKPYWTWLEITDEAEIAALVSMGRETAAQLRALVHDFKIACQGQALVVVVRVHGEILAAMEDDACIAAAALVRRIPALCRG